MCQKRIQKRKKIEEEFPIIFRPSSPGKKKESFIRKKICLERR